MFLAFLMASTEAQQLTTIAGDATTVQQAATALAAGNVDAAVTSVEHLSCFQKLHAGLSAAVTSLEAHLKAIKDAVEPEIQAGAHAILNALNELTALAGTAAITAATVAALNPTNAQAQQAATITGAIAAGAASAAKTATDLANGNNQAAAADAAATASTIATAAGAGPDVQKIISDAGAALAAGASGDGTGVVTATTNLINDAGGSSDITAVTQAVAGVATTVATDAGRVATVANAAATVAAAQAQTQGTVVGA